MELRPRAIFSIPAVIAVIVGSGIRAKVGKELIGCEPTLIIHFPCVLGMFFQFSFSYTEEAPAVLTAEIFIHAQNNPLHVNGLATAPFLDRAGKRHAPRVLTFALLEQLYGRLQSLPERICAIFNWELPLLLALTSSLTIRGLLGTPAIGITATSWSGICAPPALRNLSCRSVWYRCMAQRFSRPKSGANWQNSGRMSLQLNRR